MQRRERRLLIITLIVVLCWPLDALLLQPLLAWQAQIERETRALRLELQEVGVLLDNSHRIMVDWQRLQNAGLLDDAAAAGYRLQQTVTQAADSSGLRVASLGGARHRPAEGESAFDSVQVSLRGEGSCQQVLRFLRQLDRSPMPLRVDRCELQARDATKDLLDCSLTLSTRIVSEPQREGRHVAKATAAWSPDEPTTYPDGLQLFRVLRSSGIAPSIPIVTVAPPEPMAAPPSRIESWSLVGLVVRADPTTSEAFLRHQGSGEERVLRGGDSLDQAQVLAINGQGLHLADPALPEGRLIAPGFDLLGRPNPAAIARQAGVSPALPSAGTSAPPTHSSSGISPFSSPAGVSDEQQAILERLRQQRLRQR
jgi:hypothetical protein